MEQENTTNNAAELSQVAATLTEIEQIRQQAIKSTLQLLELENVDFMIYVDDKFDVQGQKLEFKARLLDLKNNSNPIVTDGFQELEWEDPDPRFESQVEKLWESSDRKQELLYEICWHLKDEDSANIIPVLEIKKYYGDKIKVMTPDDWVSDQYKTIAEIAEGKKVLCLFDYEFQGGNSKIPGKNGVDLAKGVIETTGISERVVCGIFSHKFSESEEEEFRNKYANDHALEKGKFYTISKKRYAIDPNISGFAEGVKNLLLHPHVEKLKEKSLEVLKSSNNKASKKIEDLSPGTFNQIVQKSSFKEGVWEISTLFRLYGILSKEENFNIISDPLERQAFNESIKKIREIDLIDTGYNAVPNNEQLFGLRNSELYLQSSVINNLHLPLTNGDIFEIKEKEYILLVQPCNLALRAKGSDCGKRDYSYDAGIIVPIREYERKNLGLSKEEIKTAEYSDKVKGAYFPGFQIISLDILDLSVFNVDGKAIIDFNQTALSNDLIHSPWIKRYEYIYKSLQSHETKIIEFNTIKKSINSTISQKRQASKELEEGEEKSTLTLEIHTLKDHLSKTEKSVLNIPDLKKFNIDCTKIYDPRSRIMDLNVKRLRHYKSPYSDDLLQKFMQYLSRNAFDHDFLTS